MTKNSLINLEKISPGVYPEALEGVEITYQELLRLSTSDIGILKAPRQYRALFEIPFHGSIYVDLSPETVKIVYKERLT